MLIKYQCFHWLTALQNKHISFPKYLKPIDKYKLKLYDMENLNCLKPQIGLNV